MKKDDSDPKPMIFRDLGLALYLHQISANRAAELKLTKRTRRASDHMMQQGRGRLANVKKFMIPNSLWVRNLDVV